MLVEEDFDELLMWLSTLYIIRDKIFGFHAVNA